MDYVFWQNLWIFILHHWLLVSCFVFLILLIIVEEGKSQGSGGGQVNPSQAISLMNDDKAVVIDIRSKEAYKRGHIVGAISFPKDKFDLSSPKLQNHKNKAIIVVCQKGNDANRLGLKIRRAGFDVKILAGGMDAWKEANLPLKTKK